ncbi:hypothetical protein Brsp06_03288 [Brucella sp. NBRC 13694]|uniref:HNH endonuclease n=1 Tax=Brucella sp. NBRC 13694 TaxID=3075482 RepID=UPI0030A69427
MRYWWVNHKQTYKEETSGGYLWSPVANKNGARNQSYDNMAEVEPGDIVFSFANGLIKQVGIATGRGIRHSKPEEFGSKGDYWSIDGWLVPVSWTKLDAALHPKSFIEELRPYLPTKYAPISAEGNGLQNSYLASISVAMADFILGMLPEADLIREESDVPVIKNLVVEREQEELEKKILNDTTIESTERESLVKARRGQGKYRKNLEGIENRCRFTGVDDRRLLRASHIKPWRLCSNNHERLDGNNGLLLTPTFDLMFDQGYISFNGDGSCLISNKINYDQLNMLGVDLNDLKYSQPFNENQEKYLDFHRVYFNFDS